MLLRGNGFAEKLLVGSRLVGLKFLVNDQLSLQKDSQNVIRYYYSENGKQREIPEEKIFRIPGFSTDGKWGISAIRYGAEVFGSALAASTAANSTFEKGLSPTVAFSVDRVLTPEQRIAFREGAAATLTGAINAGNSPILEGGMTAQVLSINPKDAQLLESRAFNVEEIARWFRVPPHMIGHSEKSTSWGTGIEQQMIGFLTFTLRPWLTRIEQHINKDLLSPAEQSRYYAEFTVEGLLRGDSTARKEFYSSALQNGWMNRNQVAAMENQPSMNGGEVYTVQSNLIPIDQLGKETLNETTTTNNF
jgi:HK97 family phage portal protein